MTCHPPNSSEEPTDLRHLTLPQECHNELARSTREEGVLRHSVRVNLDWWNAGIARRGLPGGPVADDDGSASGFGMISRGHLFDLGRDVAGEGALRLLWHTLAWGSGSTLRLCHKRLDAVRVDVARAKAMLAGAASAAMEGPGAGYEALLRPNGIAYIGPAFSSKFLYFAAGDRQGLAPLILDRRVATSLHCLCGWRSLHPGGSWPTSTYRRYCDLLDRWAREETGRLGRQVHADEIERWLFEQGADRLPACHHDR